MKKYFAVSDVHSFYTELEDALNKAGFDKKNKEHILIVCGDIFDRGDQTLQVYEFLNSIPKSRRIMIRGNHECLYLDLLEKAFPEKHDFSNGTVKTFCHIAGVGYQLSYFDENRLEKWKTIREAVKNSPITKWLKSKEWLNYFELDDHIFVHSFIPVNVKDEFAGLEYLVYYISDLGADKLKFKQNWRDANQYEWESAMWGCPATQFKSGLFKEDKTLVCGHWHAADFYKILDDDFNHDPYNGDMYNNHGLVGLDACTVISRKVNVYIIN